MNSQSANLEHQPRPRRHRLGLGAIVGLLMAVTATVSMAAPPVSASPVNVTLYTSRLALQSNQYVTLTAYTDVAVPQYSYLAIYEKDSPTAETLKMYCGGATPCSASVTNYSGSHTYVAHIYSYFGASRAPTSNTVQVTWYPWL